MRTHVLFVASLCACGGGRIEVVGHVGAGSSAPQAPQVEDQRIVMESTEIVVTAPRPAALDFPPMPAAATVSKMSLASARARADRAARTALDVTRVASLLWAEADRQEKSNSEAALDARTEAQKRLDEWVAESEESDARVLEMLAAASARIGKAKRAIAVYGELAKSAEDAERARLKAWKAWVELRNKGPLKALETLRDVNITTGPPEAAYVMGWAAFLRGDDDGARLGIASAVDRWTRKDTREVLESELLYILAYTGTTVDKLVEVLALVASNQKRLYELTFKTSKLYRQAGYYEHAGQALLYGLEEVLPADKVPAEDVVGFRFRRADYAFRVDNAHEAAADAILAHEALDNCGEACDAETKKRVIERIMRLAQFYHTSYTASLDERHYQAARDLYDYYLTLGDAGDTEQTHTLRANLEDSKKNANPANGVHDEGITTTLAQARREALVACYERVLAADPTVSGPLKLVFEIDQTGAVVGSSSEPAPGLEGTAAVAECMTRRVRTWHFPSRTVPGMTAVELAVQLTSQ